jgi:DNA replication and repair protein RecF
MTLGSAWSADSGETTGQGRQVVVDGAAQKGSGAFGAHLRLLWLTPAMDRLFAGPASDRRRFLDRLVNVFDPEHAARVLVFEKVMRERNLLLADHQPDLAWMASLEAHLAEAAVAIAAARRLGLEALQAYIDKGRGEAAFPWGELAIEGDIEAQVAVAPAVRVEDDYLRVLHDSRAMDRAAGRTLRGPHRSDFMVVHGPKQVAADQCSTGEQKALLIGLILAQAKAVKEIAGLAPVLLLDEVAAHLDLHRREGLFEALRKLGAQSWLTGTDASLFGSGPGLVLHHVEDGRIRRIVEKA